MFTTLVAPTNPTLGESKTLWQLANALANANDLSEIKKIRDTAWAAGKYARSAALGLQARNDAAEVKLRAERRAGELLLNLKLRGGDRKSNSHGESLKLADLGIDHNQSARWQREAAVPDEAFEAYVAEANAAGNEITAKGLLRLLGTTPRKKSERGRRKRGASNGVQVGSTNAIPSGKRRRSLDRNVSARGFRAKSGPGDDTAMELVEELRNHHDLLANLLEPIQAGRHEKLTAAERRIITRLLADSEHILTLLRTLLVNSVHR